MIRGLGVIKQYRVKFSKEEDEIVKEFYIVNKGINWSQFSEKLPGRTERQCKERFSNYLDPSLTNSEWKLEEDLNLYNQVTTIGMKWALLCTYFPGRSANNIKNRWYRHIIKKLSFFENYNQNTKNKIDEPKKQLNSQNQSENLINKIFALDPPDSFMYWHDNQSQFLLDF